MHNERSNSMIIKELRNYKNCVKDYFKEENKKFLEYHYRVNFFAEETRNNAYIIITFSNMSNSEKYNNYCIKTFKVDKDTNYKVDYKKIKQYLDKVYLHIQKGNIRFKIYSVISTFLTDLIHPKIYLKYNGIPNLLTLFLCALIAIYIFYLQFKLGFAFGIAEELMKKIT